MHGIQFIQDLSVTIMVAGMVTILFHRFKQPVVLGYILAGIIIGPYTPPFQLVEDRETIRTLAELGIVFLLFSLGLEFSLRKLSRVGATAFVAASSEIVLMIWVGYEIGRFFDWSRMDSVFLGAMLAISSTTIIIKALDELGMKRERFAQLIFGILIVEDVLAIGMIALLSGIAISGSVDAEKVASTVARLSLFMVVALVVGILVVPRVLAYVARFRNNEVLLITVLGLCFGFCLVVVKLDYSIALGAFLIGAIMAESKQLHTIERLIAPVRDMFSAIFFVAIGLMFDPNVLVDYAVPVAVITIAVVIGKVVTCSFGTFIAGNDGRTSMRVGMGLAQIGEFSFIIATMGLALNVISDFLYPIAVAVSAVTTLLTPYLIRMSDPILQRVIRVTPESVSRTASIYTEWLQSIMPQGNSAVLARMVRRILLQVMVNLALVAALFLAARYFGNRPRMWESIPWHTEEDIRNTILWLGVLLLSTPFLIAAYRKLKALSMLLAELSVKPQMAGRHTQNVRRVVSEVIPVAAIVGLLGFLTALSTSILPPAGLLIPVLVVVGIIAALLWGRFIKLHTRLQVALMETLEQKPEKPHD
jgi:monovalent cation:H+ antiporter-2, CPA2 family